MSTKRHSVLYLLYLIGVELIIGLRKMKLFSIIILVAFESLLAVDAFLLDVTHKYCALGVCECLVAMTKNAGAWDSSYSRLFASSDGGDDNDDEEEEMIDINSLGDWRAFRMNLAAAAGSSSDNSKERPKHTHKGGDISRKNIVSKLNEELLKSQNPSLAEEYVSNAWAHKTSQPELGGLVCRLPLEAELHRNKSSKLGVTLRNMLGQSENNSIVSSESISTPIWYRWAQKLIKEQLTKIQKIANDKNEIDASKLTQDTFEFLSMYLDNKSSWQEVCLVVEQDDDLGECTTLVLNRPISMKANEDLAKLILFGLKSTAASVSEKTQRLVNFLNAFEDSCAVYVGGPDEQEEPATLIHGISGLEGSFELSPFSNIYQGGLEAAIQGIMAGKYDPLEFRFFVGKHKYKDKLLQRMVYAGKYQPVACARSIALKQCLSLPKPLWHEVMEMCGGELKEISKLELMKRSDIQVEEIDENGKDGA